jgi:thiol-disulfide isomerase/thioredoxin
MRRLFLALLPVLLLVAGCSTAAAGAGLAEGTVLAADNRPAAPPVTGDLLDGSGRYDLANHRGEVVVVNFWGSWCGPCVGEADALQQTYLATKGNGVSFVGVDVRDSRDAASEFASLRTTYPNIFDPASKVALGFPVPPTTPSTYIVDRQGRLALVLRRPVLKDELTSFVNQLAAESR